VGTSKQLCADHGLALDPSCLSSSDSSYLLAFFQLWSQLESPSCQERAEAGLHLAWLECLWALPRGEAVGCVVAESESWVTPRYLQRGVKALNWKVLQEEHEWPKLE